MLVISNTLNYPCLPDVYCLHIFFVKIIGFNKVFGLPTDILFFKQILQIGVFVTMVAYYLLTKTYLWFLEESKPWFFGKNLNYDENKFFKPLENRIIPY